MKRSQNSGWPSRIAALVRKGNLGVVEDGAAGVGGFAGMKNAGTAQMELMIDTYKTMRETSEELLTQNGTTSCPSAAPKGLARDVKAVAATRPRLVNQRSE